MFAAVFTALAPREGMSVSAAATTVAGVLAGSMLWWCLVVLFASGLRHAIGARARAVIDQVSGVVLVALGAAEINRGLAASR
jgi:threonine/homoserine/homoserine lactone efflux protein